MISVEFYAAGLPSTKGSARAFVRGGRAIITNDAGARAKVWAGIVSGAAAEVCKAPVSGPVAVGLTFMLPRPQSHYGAKGLKPTAPRYCAKKPDGDKLARCCLDALTGIVYVDDAQIVELAVVKRYADGATGVAITIGEVEP